MGGGRRLTIGSVNEPDDEIVHVRASGTGSQKRVQRVENMIGIVVREVRVRV